MGKISSKRMMYSVAVFITASSLLTKELYAYLNHEAWIGVLLGFFMSLLIVWMYQALAKRYPAKSIIEIDDAVYGCILGKAISAVYIFYFYSLTILNLNILGEFVKSMILPNTPLPIIYILFIVICAWALKKGMITLTRCSTLLLLLPILSLLIGFVLLYRQIEWNNLFPLFTLPAENYIKGTHLVTVIPFCEIFAFLMLSPYMQKPEELGKTLRAGLVMGASFLFLIVLRDIAVMGNYLVVSTMPSFSVLRLINVSEILTRLEIIYAFVIISLFFFKISILYFAAVSGMSKLMKSESYQYLICIFGALIVVYTKDLFASAMEHAQWILTAGQSYSTFFLILLPAITLIVAAVRKASDQSQETAQQGTDQGGEQEE